MDWICYNAEVCLRAKPIFGLQNPAFRSGEGLIETMLWESGEIRFLKDHLQRLTKSMAFLKWRFDAPDESQWYARARRLTALNQVTAACVVRVQVFPEGEGIGLVMETIPLPELQVPLVLGIASGVGRNADSYSWLKTSSRMFASIAGHQAVEQGWTDALLLNQHGRIAESTIANVFWIRDHHLYTPPLAEGCVAGILRQQIFSGIRNIRGLPLTEKILTLEEAAGAEALFLTNAVRGIRKVQKLVLP